MDFSIKNISNKKQLNFKGVKGDFNSENKQVFRFNAPSYKQNETPYLELTLLDYESEQETNNFVPYRTGRRSFEGKTTIELPQDFSRRGPAEISHEARG